MPSDHCHIHWTGAEDEEVTIIDQSLRITVNEPGDPAGTLRIRQFDFSSPGLGLPSEGWQAIPGTSPTLEARQDAHYPLGLIQVRQA